MCENFDKTVNVTAVERQRRTYRFQDS